MLEMVFQLKPGDFVHPFGDVHIYSNHVEQVKLQLSRQPFPLPTLKLNAAVSDLFSFQFEDIEILNYQCHPAIKAPVAV